MEWLCCRLWAMFPTTLEFLNDNHTDPVKMAMALNPTTRGCFVAGYRVIYPFYRWFVVCATFQHGHPEFIPCVWPLFERWLLNTLW